MKILVCDPFNQVADIKQKQYRRVFYNKEFFKKNFLIFSKKDMRAFNFLFNGGVIRLE